MKITGNQVLKNDGSISHEEAIKKAGDEFEKYKQQVKNELSAVEKHFIEQIDQTTRKLKAGKSKK